ncbi:MAG TPA: NAD(P)/FAD-dependent oxidoreductase [Rhizomicrobium sp.]
MAIEHFDVLIVGAGLSGIGAAHHLQRRCPNKTYAILEGRSATGGTWDLFRYPGIRSDSDMYTMGYSFRPWTNPKAIADGPSILNYIRDTAKEAGIDRHIRFGHWVTRASWSSDDAVWTVEAARKPLQDGAPEEVVRFTCNFLFMCSGYYRYTAGYLPDFQSIERFRGLIVHPQKWPEGLDYAGMRVIVIGSGATAVTLVPELAKTARYVTMLQRSPTYIVSRPEQDAFANWLRTHLPAKLAYTITRWRLVLLGMWFFRLCRKKPEQVKDMIKKGVRAELGPDYDVETHFTPRYNPWDQRLCLVPDADLFHAMKSGRASIVTDHIERFTEKGLKLESGSEIEADIIVTATGLVMELLGGMEVSVDGERIDFSKTLNYRGAMYSGVPNLASAFGYTNASWTLKCDLTCEYVCRLLNTMDRRGLRQCTPRNNDPLMPTVPWLDFSSGYVQRAMARFPKQGTRAPWKLYQNYALDIVSLRYGKMEDGVLEFSNPVPANLNSGTQKLAG